MRTQDRSTLRRLGRDRKATITVLVATAMPLLAAAGALGMEVTHWSNQKMRLQRVADTAALAGIIKYGNTDSAQSGATSSLKFAELAGITAGGTPTWNNSTSTFANTTITARLEAGVKDTANNKAMYVRISTAVPRGISSLLGSGSSVNISAWAKAELDGAQPCLVTLSNGALTFQNNPVINSSTCAIWSNGPVIATNSVTVNVRDT